MRDREISGGFQRFFTSSVFSESFNSVFGGFRTCNERHGVFSGFHKVARALQGV